MAAADMTADQVDAAEEKRHLRRTLRRIDVLSLLLCTLIGVDLIGAAASEGAQGFTYLVGFALLFFLPSAALVAELSAAFPVEGGPYMWVRMAFGHVAAAIANALYWLTNPLWLGGTLATLAVTTWSEFFFPLDGLARHVAALLFVWAAIVSVMLSARAGRVIPIIGAISRVVLLGAFTVSVLVYGAAKGLGGVGLADFAPTWAGFVALLPVILFKYAGFEVPSAAGEELVNPRRDVPVAIARSAASTILLYGVPILSILLVLPADHVSSLGGFIDAIRVVFTVYGGSVHIGANNNLEVTLTGWGAVLGDLAALGFILTLLTGAVAWIIGADRAVAVSAMDGAAPRWLGRISPRLGTPVRVNLLSGVAATLTLMAASALTHDDANKLFNAGLGVALSTTIIAYLVIFPALVRLRSLYPDTPRPYRVPGGTAGAWVASVTTTGWVALGVAALIWPGLGSGWFGTAPAPNGGLPSGWTADERWLFTLTQTVPLLAAIALGLLFYRAGRATRARARQPRPPPPTGSAAR